jgi:hypothetical protein
VFSSVQDGLAVLDADLKIVRTNPTLDKLFSDQMPLADKPAAALFGPAVAEPLAAALRDGQPARADCTLETAQGRREFSLFSYPWLERRSGRQKGVILGVRDVTNERQLQQQLFQAQKMESIGRLAGGVAHDFNNILQAILGFSEILAAEIPETDPARQDVLEIRKTTERGVALTRQLLALSRKQVLAAVDLDLNELVERMGGICTLLGANCRIRFDVDSVPARAHGDAGQSKDRVNWWLNGARRAPGRQIANASRTREFRPPPRPQGTPWARTPRLRSCSRRHRHPRKSPRLSIRSSDEAERQGDGPGLVHGVRHRAAARRLGGRGDGDEPRLHVHGLFAGRGRSAARTARMNAPAAAPKPLRVLVIEDSEVDALLLLEQLKAGGYAPAARRVDNAADLAEALDTQPWARLSTTTSAFRQEALALVRFGLDVRSIVSGAIAGSRRWAMGGARRLL